MQPRIYVDFNEMLSANEVLLSQADYKIDSEGNVVEFVEGKPIAVYMDDTTPEGKPDYLIADGVALRNTSGGWASAATWVLQIDTRGIRRASEEANS